MLWGASFPLALGAASRRGEDPGGLVGRVYAANTAGAILGAARKENLLFADVSQISEPPGQGLSGTVDGRHVLITGRHAAVARGLPLPPLAGGLECIVIVDGRYAATMRFRDTPRTESLSFISHLRPRHAVQRVILVSGDRESEVRYLADELGIKLVANVAAGVLAEDPKKFGGLFILVALPGTQGFYGFLGGFLAMMKLGVLGTLAPITLWQGIQMFAACVPVLASALWAAGALSARAAPAGPARSSRGPAGCPRGSRANS